MTKLILSALFGASLTLLVQWIKGWRDDLKQICDEFCKIVSDAADLGSNYWLKNGGDPELPILEVRLLGCQAKIGKLLTYIIDNSYKDHENILNSHIASLYDCLTGGDFGNNSRQPDIQRARLAQFLAADVIVSVRRSFSGSVSGRRNIYRWFFSMTNLIKSCLSRSKQTLLWLRRYPYTD